MKQKALMRENYKSYIQDAFYNAYIYMQIPIIRFCIYNEELK